MKTYIKKISYSFLVFSIAILQACSSYDDSSVVNKVLATTTTGIAIRTISTPNASFNFFDPSQNWSVIVEAVDGNGGAAFKEVQVFVSRISEGKTSEEKSIKTIPASGFNSEASPDGLPRAEIKVTLTEAIAALGLKLSEITSNDQFIIRLVAVTTDGRTFSTDNSSPTITGGTFFSSPFKYSVQFFCPIANASQFNGNYKVTADAWQDYNIGDVIPVVYNQADGLLSFRILGTKNTFISNSTTAYWLVTIDPNNGSVTLKSNEDFNYGGGSITTVTGTGSVGTCTGDINLSLNFPGLGGSNQNFKLVKM